MNANIDQQLQPNPKRWKILQIINMGTLISTLDVGIVNVSLPTMADQFGVSLAQIQWVSTCYLLTMIVLLPFLGKVSDRWNRRKMYSIGFFIFSIGSALIALSDGFISLLASRALQGVGAAMIMANSQAMVRQLFPDKERGRALGMNAVVISIGTISGPALGGLLLEWMSWPWLFWLNVPIGLCAFVLGSRWFPQTEAGSDRSPIDLVGSVLLGAGLCLLMLAAEGSQYSGGFTSAQLVQGLIGIILFIALVLHQRKIKHGIIDRELFGIRAVAIGNSSSLLINLAQTATMLPIVFYLQGPLGFSPWITGVLLILQPLLMGVTAPFAGKLRDSFGGKFPVTFGALLCSVSMLFITLAPQVSLIAIALQLACFGIGIGFFHATNNAEVMSASPDHKISLAGSLLALVRYLGQVAGIGLAALLVGSLGPGSALHPETDSQIRLLFWVCFICCMSAAALGRWNLPAKAQKTPQSG